MALIYAFGDPAGTWHGDPYADIAEAEPGHDTLTMPPAAGPGPSPFAGQQLHVIYARTDLEAAPSLYRLDSGTTLHATWRVHELLDTAYQPPHTPTAAVTPASRSERALDVDITHTPYRYALSADRTGPDRLEVTAMVSRTDTAEILGELTGDIAPADLDGLAELLTHAARSLAGQAAASSDRSAGAAGGAKPRAANTGQPWTEELHQELRRRFEEGISPQDLADEFGRGVRAIRWKLYSLKLIPFPEDLVADAGRAPARPAPPKAWTASDVRREHPNAYKRWTSQEEQHLAERSAEGASIEELCTQFGRNRGAIEGRLVKIGATGPAADQARSMFP